MARNSRCNRGAAIGQQDEGQRNRFSGKLQDKGDRVLELRQPEPIYQVKFEDSFLRNRITVLASKDRVQLSIRPQGVKRRVKVTGTITKLHFHTYGENMVKLVTGGAKQGEIRQMTAGENFSPQLHSEIHRYAVKFLHKMARNPGYIQGEISGESHWLWVPQWVTFVKIG
ncbi:hypothetical protein DFH09DRAFT_1072454 [Mycena vulgaris]|nr:hypothetical protein DFH09DRAFT_1072454 [Mycena vulgaris]